MFFFVTTSAKTPLQPHRAGLGTGPARHVVLWLDYYVSNSISQYKEVQSLHEISRSECDGVRSLFKY